MIARDRNYSSTTKINHQTWIFDTSSLSILIFKARFHPFDHILAFYTGCLISMTMRRWNTLWVTKSYFSLPNLSETNLRFHKFHLLDPPDGQARHPDHKFYHFSPQFWANIYFTRKSKTFAKIIGSYYNSKIGELRPLAWNLSLEFSWKFRIVELCRLARGFTYFATNYTHRTWHPLQRGYE